MAVPRYVNITPRMSANLRRVAIDAFKSSVGRLMSGTIDGTIEPQLIRPDVLCTISEITFTPPAGLFPYTEYNSHYLTMMQLMNRELEGKYFDEGLLEVHSLQISFFSAPKEDGSVIYGVRAISHLKVVAY